MKTKTWIFFTLAVTAIIGFADISYSIEKKLVIGVEDVDYLPHYSSRDGEYRGFGREVIDLFATRYGYAVHYKILPTKRLFWEFLHKKEIDLMYPDNPRWSVDMKQGKRVVYNEKSVVDTVFALLVLPEKKSITKDKLKRVGILRGYTTWGLNDLIAAGQIELHSASHYPSLLKMVLHKHLDAVFSDIAAGRHFMAKEMTSGQELVFAAQLPYTVHSFYFSTIRRPEVIRKINEFMRREKEAIDLLKRKNRVIVDLPRQTES